MPDPKNYKLSEKNKFLSDCFSKLKEEGKTHKQSQGQCLGMWNQRVKQKKSKGDTSPITWDEIENLPYRLIE